jgi:hypothetical protein
MTLMRTAKSKSSTSQPKREKPAATVAAAPVQAASANTRTYGLPGTAAERQARRRRLMEEHRETLRRLGE